MLSGRTWAIRNSDRILYTVKAITNIWPGTFSEIVWYDLFILQVSCNQNYFSIIVVKTCFNIFISVCVCSQTSRGCGQFGGNGNWQTSPFEENQWISSVCMHIVIKILFYLCDLGVELKSAYLLFPAFVTHMQLNLNSLQCSHDTPNKDYNWVYTYIFAI